MFFVVVVVFGLATDFQPVQVKDIVKDLPLRQD